MSSYLAQARRKGQENWEEVEMIDDFFGHHLYGVKFPNGEIIRERECEVRQVTVTKYSLPSEKIRVIYDEMKQNRLDYHEEMPVDNKFDSINALFGNESKLLKAIIYYLDNPR